MKEGQDDRRGMCGLNDPPHIFGRGIGVVVPRPGDECEPAARVRLHAVITVVHSSSTAIDQASREHRGYMKGR